MKKHFKLIPMLLMGFLLMTTSCEDDDESCQQFDSDVGSCAAEDITTCCNDDGSCYYLYKTIRYDSVDELAEVCKDGSVSMEEINLQIDDFTKKLIKEARGAAVCK